MNALDVSVKTGFDGPIFADPELKIAGAFGAGIGTVTIIDRKGVVRWQKPGTKFKRPTSEVVAHALRAIVTIDRQPGALEKARAAARSSSAATREKGAADLGLLESKADSPLLQQLLADKTAPVALAAAAALRWLRDGDAIPAICKVASNEKVQTEVRAAAADLLVHSGDDYNEYPGPFWRLEFTHAVSTALLNKKEDVLRTADVLSRSSDATLRTRAARILWRLKSAAPRDKLLAMLKDDSESVRIAALSALAAGFRTDPAVQSAATTIGATGDFRNVVNYILKGPEGKIRE
jgi:HEAT repeat protein